MKTITLVALAAFALVGSSSPALADQVEAEATIVGTESSEVAARADAEPVPEPVPAAATSPATEESEERGIVGYVYPPVAAIGNSFLSGADFLDREIQRVFPLAKEIAGDRADELPLPVGLTLGYNHQWDRMEISDLAIAINDRPERPLPGGAVTNIRSSTNTYTFQADLWLLPFVNLFGLLGYSEGSATADLNIGGLPRGEIEIPYYVLSYGGGVNVVVGWENFFAVGNATFTQQKVNLFDDLVNVIYVAPRVGWQNDFGWSAISIWTGANYMSISSERSGTLVLPLPRSPEVRWRADVQPVAPWNASLGGRMSIGKRFDFVVDAGLGTRRSIMVSGAFRF